jgi:hypothetical protein
VCLGGGGLSSAPLHLSGEQVQQVASGYARLVTPFHCSISVSFSFSTFLCFAASWTGVDKKYSHYLCRTALMGYSGAWEKLIHEKNMKSKKISCHCPCLKAKLTQAVINKHHVPFIHRKLIVFSHRCERKPFFIPLKAIFVLKYKHKITKYCSMPFYLEENGKFCFFICTINPEIIFQESEIVFRAKIFLKIHQQTFQ